jgi:hypothetical protein
MSVLRYMELNTVLCKLKVLLDKDLALFVYLFSPISFVLFSMLISHNSQDLYKFENGTLYFWYFVSMQYGTVVISVKDL